MSNAFAWVFLAALAASSATRLWLAQRQMRHVRAHRGEVPQTFAAAIPLDAHQKAADYTVAKARLGMLDVLIGAAVLLALTLGDGIQRLSELWAQVFPDGSILHGSALILSVVFLQSLVGLPLAVYRTFVVEQRFGFNRMTPRLFVTDLVKSTLLALALGVPLLLAVLWLMERMGPWWWLYVWIVWTAFSLGLMMAYPAYILPLFNKFTPLAQGELSERVERLLARTGFRSRGLYVMDGSKRSSHGNAFFAGLGAGKRIVLFDTLVSRLAPAEVEAVLAHELGHYKLHHIAKALALSAAVSFAGLWLLGQLIDQPWFYQGLGVATPGTAAALLLFMLVVPEFMFFLHPLTSRYSRKREFEADAYAMQHARSSDLVQALVKLYKDNAATLTPDPLHSAFYDSHPPAATRIARLRTA
ncbi:MAG TPA: M48 family metallopeptidase [Burkholderiales bacterium]|jgi:STE24 endopeptidase|nr:M48 family metallopeptidase [Burkholderiales bacterium]